MGASHTNLPTYLQSYVATQDPSLYTATDHASWRYILRISKRFFRAHAHPSYLDGLEKTGITTDRIPLISEMNEKLNRFHWGAVPVVGFIPPAVFMEFLSRKVLPIACDMRTLGHLAYTPAPDIVHEAAGHAPIIADPEYAAYLESYGEIAAKVIFSSRDMDVYDAIRNLSDVKEDPKSTDRDIDAAQERLNQANAATDYVSEATELSRMGWWTFEYGLIGDLKNPRIYGAGLLSSVAESYHCLSDEVRKIPFSVECIHTSYDITRPQPQLFVTPDFKTLELELEKLTERMAYKRGGEEGLLKAAKAATVTTTVFESGIQISGILAEILRDDSGQPCYLKYTGPVQLAHGEEELKGHGPERHGQGFSTPLGPLKGLALSAADLSETQLQSLGLGSGRPTKFEFESGVTIEGKLVSRIELGGKNLILTFTECTVKRGGTVLFQPAWGDFDLACGSKVTSVFGGPADHARFLEKTEGFWQCPTKPKTNLTDENKLLNTFYARVREIRESGRIGPLELEELGSVLDRLRREDPKDWLLRIEILELAVKSRGTAPWAAGLREDLARLSRGSQELSEVIARGMEVLAE